LDFTALVKQDEYGIYIATVVEVLERIKEAIELCLEADNLFLFMVLH